MGGGKGPKGRSGPDFFEGRVMDDPESPILYDPQLEGYPEFVYQILSGPQQTGLAREGQTPEPVTSNPLQQAGFSSEVPAKTQIEKKDQPQPGFELKGPRQNVTIDPIPELGIVIIRTQNAQDMKEILALIDQIQGIAKTAQVKIEIIPLKNGDATSISNSLNLLYQRVQIGPNSSYILPGGNTSQARPPGAGGAQLGQPQQGGAAITQLPGVGGVQQAAVYITPLVRYNALLIAAPESRIEDIKKDVDKLDQPHPADAQAVRFQLQRAPANRVAAIIQGFWGIRYSPQDVTNQVKVTFDDQTNTVWVQAAPADLAEIRDLINLMDATATKTLNDLRLVRLVNSFSDDVANLLVQTLQAAYVQPLTPTPAVTPGIGGAPVAPRPGLGGPLGAAGTVPGGTSAQTKSWGVRFFSSDPKAQGVFTADVLEDVHIGSDPRTNTLIIAAPEKTMTMLLALVGELDTAPRFLSTVNIINLKNSDATQILNILQQMFLGSGATTGTGGAAGGRAGGFGGPGGALGGTTGTVRPPIFTLSGVSPEGVPLIDVRVTIDPISNSIIVAGSRNDIDVITAIVERLEQSNKSKGRVNEAFQMYNAQAVDVANALTTFYTNALVPYTTAIGNDAYVQLLQNVIIVAEPVTNKVLVSASPDLYPQVVKLIEQLDILPPQVRIQCVIAEVDMTGTEEVGCEIGLQSPLMFNRAVYPAPSAAAGSTTSIATPAIPSGFTVNSTTNPVSQYGYQFNNTSNPIGTNPAVSPGKVGYQGLGNLGVGLVSPTSGVGGFVFNAVSDSVSVLIRALQTQGRVEILSRPQVTTADNQAARILVGQNFPFITGSVVTTGISGIPTVTNTITYKDIGIQLQVTPKINPDGTVIMRVIPEVSSPANTTVNIGNGVLAQALNIQTIETTVICNDGETVGLGGLISKNDTKQENKVPWLGDVPWLGAAFRYRTEMKSKTELLVILTPHVVRSRAEREMILQEEAAKMDWNKNDLIHLHGMKNLAPVFGPPPGVGGMPSYNGLSPMPQPMLGPVPGLAPEALPLPRPAPGQPGSGLQMPQWAPPTANPPPCGISVPVTTTPPQRQ